MDLAKQIKLDETKTDDGVWFTFMDDARFKVRASGTTQHRIIQTEITERYRAQLRVGGVVAVEARMNIMRDLVAEYHLADWEHVENNGVALECTLENRQLVARDYAAVVMFVVGCSNELGPYRLAQEPEGVHRD